MADRKIALTKPVQREPLTELALNPLHVQYHLEPDVQAGMVTIQAAELPDEFHDWLLERARAHYEKED